MKSETKTTYVAEDGKRFDNKAACLKHESEVKEFRELIESKIGKYGPSDLILGGPRGEAKLSSLPFTAPWMSAFGACLITVTDIRRAADNTVEFQLADENNVPYKDGDAWEPSTAFYAEWPD